MSLYLPNFSRNRILVVGDIMLDRYWSGSTSRVSPEAPVPIVKIENTEHRLGGAANVALNLSVLGCDTSLFGIIGKDRAGDIVRELLDASNIKHDLHLDAENPTTTKLRVMSQHQQLIRLDFEEPFTEISHKLELAELENAIMDFDAVVISDYAKGAISDANYIIALCNKNSIPVLVDPKGLDFSGYANANILTPNRSEIESIVGKQNSLAELFTAAGLLREQLQVDALVITLGEKGMALLEQGKKPAHIPTVARDVFDVTGAGDTVISTLAAVIASKNSMEEAMRLANIAAGIAVGKSGTASVSPLELGSALVKPRSKSDSKILSLKALKTELESAKSRGEKIVFTNGCFDILHAGHVRYLQQASELGDKLIVAVNSDASVRRLKGPERPINDLQSRMQVLAALDCVDWAIAFEEETPLRLIEELLPQFLVKGGDYKAEDIIGNEIVTKNNGEVIVMPFYEGYSTSGILKKIK